jgi:hypothetical protein
MKTVINFVITLATVTLFAACGNTQKPAEADAHAGHNHAPGEGHRAPTEKPVLGVSVKDDQLNAVYQQYVQLVKALVDGDVVEVKVAANALELGAKGLKNGKALTTMATQIGAATNIEAQRTLFADLSNDMIARVKAAGLNSGEIYVEYCSMAFNNKGASWLSNEKEIKNPYYGASMLTCGEIKETLN